MPRTEGSAVTSGETEKQRAMPLGSDQHVEQTASSAKFDRNAYQREYMRKRRAEMKEKPND